MTNRTLLTIFFGLTILLVASYFAYTKFKDNTSGELITIYADQEETKIKPQEAGGIIIPNSDNVIYETLGNQQPQKKINILPEPEQALTIINPKTENNDSQDSIDSILDSILSNEEEDEIQEKISQSQQSIDSIMPDELKPTQSEAAPAPEAPSSTQAKTLKVIKVTERTNKIEKDKTAARNSSDTYKIQLASVKSSAEGLEEGERIKRKHQKILGSAVISLKKVQHDNGQFFYLVLAGNYQTVSRAKVICKKLSSRGQQCIVSNPSSRF